MTEFNVSRFAGYRPDSREQADVATLHKQGRGNVFTKYTDFIDAYDTSGGTRQNIELGNPFKTSIGFSHIDGSQDMIGIKVIRDPAATTLDKGTITAYTYINTGDSVRRLSFDPYSMLDQTLLDSNKSVLAYAKDIDSLMQQQGHHSMSEAEMGKLPVVGVEEMTSVLEQAAKEEPPRVSMDELSQLHDLRCRGEQPGSQEVEEVFREFGTSIVRAIHKYPVIPTDDKEIRVSVLEAASEDKTTTFEVQAGGDLIDEKSLTNPFAIFELNQAYQNGAVRNKFWIGLENNPITDVSQVRSFKTDEQQLIRPNSAIVFERTATGAPIDLFTIRKFRNSILRGPQISISK